MYPILKTAGAFVLIVLGVWAHDEYDESRRIQRLNSMLNETQLIQVMNHVLACLQRYKLEKSSYPDNLAATASVRGCSSLDANPGKVVGYTLSYGPIGPAPGKAESFQLEAHSEGGWFQHADPYIADSSGIIYGHTQFAVRAMGGSEGAMVPRFGAAWRDLHPRSRILTPMGSFGIFKTGVLIDPVNGKTRMESLCSEW
jgi:hypothetical protein